MVRKQNVLKEWIIFAGLLVLASLFTLFILIWDKHTIKIENLGVFFFKLIPFFIALISISFFPVYWVKAPWNVLFMLLNFFVLFCLFMPKLFFNYWQQNWDQFYLVSEMFVPFLILSIAFNFRLAGGKRYDINIFGTVALLFMVSGIEDLFYILINSKPYLILPKIPDEWSWAHHMTVFVGRVLNKYEALIFIAIHFIIIIIIFIFAYTKNNFIKRFFTLLRNKSVLTIEKWVKK